MHLLRSLWHSLCECLYTWTLWQRVLAIIYGPCRYRKGDLARTNFIMTLSLFSWLYLLIYDGKARGVLLFTSRALRHININIRRARPTYIVQHWPKRTIRIASDWTKEHLQVLCLVNIPCVPIKCQCAQINEHNLYILFMATPCWGKIDLKLSHSSPTFRSRLSLWIHRWSRNHLFRSVHFVFEKIVRFAALNKKLTHILNLYMFTLRGMLLIWQHDNAYPYYSYKYNV